MPSNDPQEIYKIGGKKEEPILNVFVIDSPGNLVLIEQLQLKPQSNELGREGSTTYCSNPNAQGKKFHVTLFEKKREDEALRSMLASLFREKLATDNSFIKACLLVTEDMEQGLVSKYQEVAGWTLDDCVVRKDIPKEIISKFTALEGVLASKLGDTDRYPWNYLIQEDGASKKLCAFDFGESCTSRESFTTQLKEHILAYDTLHMDRLNTNNGEKTTLLSHLHHQCSRTPLALYSDAPDDQETFIQTLRQSMLDLKDSFDNGLLTNLETAAYTQIDKTYQSLDDNSIDKKEKIDQIIIRQQAQIKTWIGHIKKRFDEMNQLLSDPVEFQKVFDCVSDLEKVIKKNEQASTDKLLELWNRLRHDKPQLNEQGKRLKERWKKLDRVAKGDLARAKKIAALAQNIGTPETRKTKVADNNLHPDSPTEIETHRFFQPIAPTKGGAASASTIFSEGNNTP